jgi:hypothetical protein
MKHAWRSVALGVAAFADACGLSGHGAVPVRGAQLMAVVPDTVFIGDSDLPVFELRGVGFDSSRAEPRNTVRFGPLTLNAVPSTKGGTRISVVLPAEIPSNGEAPPSPWRSGRYMVQVSTPSGSGDSTWIYLAVRSGVRP